VSDRFVYDPSRPDFQARIYDIYRTLRDEHPVYRNPDTGVYALSRFEDVREAASDPEAFSSEGTSLGVGLLPHIQVMDPPRHDRLRRLVTVAFTPRRVTEMEPRVREIARGLLDRFAGKGRADLMADYARHLPSRVIGDMIGVPAERREDFLHWTESMVAVADGTTQAGNIRSAAANIYGEFARLLDERRRARRDDLMSALQGAEIDGERLTQDELLGFCFVLIVAGNDTTTNLIANGAILLAQHDDARRELCAEPASLEDAIEEMLRCESPAQALPRRATRDLVRHGVTIREGSEVQLVWGAANRDEREFDDPDRFDVHRRIRRHLAFGQGLHFCLGANLARLELAAILREIIGRLGSIELAGPVERVRSSFVGGIKRMPIRFRVVG
jgi:cytochrome P450 family 130